MLRARPVQGSSSRLKILNLFGSFWLKGGRFSHTIALANLKITENLSNSKLTLQDSHRMDQIDGKLGFIDIGANLLDSMYEGVYNEGKSYHPADLDAVLARAWSSGLRKIIITAGNLEGAKAALKLARTDGNASPL